MTRSLPVCAFAAITLVAFVYADPETNEKKGARAKAGPSKRHLFKRRATAL